MFSLIGQFAAEKRTTARVIGRFIKRKRRGKMDIERPIRGSSQQIAGIITASQDYSCVLNTAYIERLNTTLPPFRQRIAWLTRRSHVLALRTTTLAAGMYFARNQVLESANRLFSCYRRVHSSMEKNIVNLNDIYWQQLDPSRIKLEQIPMHLSSPENSHELQIDANQALLSLVLVGNRLWKLLL